LRPRFVLAAEHLICSDHCSAQDRYERKESTAIGRDQCRGAKDGGFERFVRVEEVIVVALRHEAKLAVSFDGVNDSVQDRAELRALKSDEIVNGIGALFSHHDEVSRLNNRFHTAPGGDQQTRRATG